MTSTCPPPRSLSEYERLAESCPFLLKFKFKLENGIYFLWDRSVCILNNIHLVHLTSGVGLPPTTHPILTSSPDTAEMFSGRLMTNGTTAKREKRKNVGNWIKSIRVQNVKIGELICPSKKGRREKVHLGEERDQNIGIAKKEVFWSRNGQNVGCFQILSCFLQLRNCTYERTGNIIEYLTG